VKSVVPGRVPELRGHDTIEDGDYRQCVVGAEVGGVAAHPGDGLPKRGRLRQGLRVEDLAPGPTRCDERFRWWNRVTSSAALASGDGGFLGSWIGAWVETCGGEGLGLG